MAHRKTPRARPSSSGGIPENLIRRLLPETLTQMQAETAAFMADYVPRVEREANRDWRTNVELFRDLVLHHFNQTAREVLGVCKSVEEFEKALLNEIPRFVEFTLSHYPFIDEPLQDEMSTGFALYCLRVNLWAQIADGEREKVWHVGAMTGETLEHAALNWQAEAWKRAAAGRLTNGGEATANMESEQRVGKRKGGRPQTISDEKKAAALKIRESGGTLRDAAVKLYGIYPTPQQVKNASTILRVYKRASGKSPSCGSKR